MFNFHNISTPEFEQLARDVMQKKLNIKLRTYAQGPDNGIDIRGFIGNDVVIQVKHYINSTFSDLRNALKIELEKIRKLKPERYIIVTSYSLTPSNEKEIYTMFSEFMKDKEDIIDINILTAFLENEDNTDILKIHNKLWFTSTNILKIIFNKVIEFDSVSFKNDYEAKSKFFVYTSAYHDVLNLLKHKNVLIIEGDPGVGKSTLSQLIIMYFCLNGYKLRYASSNSISEVKKGIIIAEKEIILMDNFLGQRITDISFHFFSELKALIHFADFNKNKIIIINSRTIVLNEAIRTNQVFKDLLKNDNICRYNLKIENISYLEKSKILYNYMYFKRLSNLHIESIKRDEHYFEIVQHKNFSPRIIDYVTSNEIVSNIDSNEYFQYIIKTLNNPKDIWKDEFQNLTRFDKLFLFTMYTLISFGRLNGDYISIEILKECFEHRLRKESSYDSTVHYFDDILEKLIGGLIQITISNKKSSVRFINPSVEDYIHEYLSELNFEIQEIAQSAIYLEQLVVLYKLAPNVIRDIVARKIENDSFLTLKTFTDLNKMYYYLRFIFDYDCKFPKLKTHVYQLFNTHKAFSKERYIDANLIMDYMFEKDMYIFCQLEKLLYNDSFVTWTYELLNFNQIIRFHQLYEKTINPNKDSNQAALIADKFASYISWEIELDIIHNSDTRLKESIGELKKIVGDFEEFSPEEIENKYDYAKEIFVNQCLVPLIDERKKALEFSSIKDHLFVSTETILSEISFRDALLWDSLKNNEYIGSRKYSLSDDSKAIVDLFGAEVPQNNICDSNY